MKFVMTKKGQLALKLSCDFWQAPFNSKRFKKLCQNLSDRLLQIMESRIGGICATQAEQFLAIQDFWDVSREEDLDDLSSAAADKTGEMLQGFGEFYGNDFGLKLCFPN